MAPHVCEYAETMELVTVSDCIEGYANKADTRPTSPEKLMVKCHRGARAAGLGMEEDMGGKFPSSRLLFVR